MGRARVGSQALNTAAGRIIKTHHSRIESQRFFTSLRLPFVILYKNRSLFVTPFTNTLATMHCPQARVKKRWIKGTGCLAHIIRLACSHRTAHESLCPCLGSVSSHCWSDDRHHEQAKPVASVAPVAGEAVGSAQSLD